MYPTKPQMGMPGQQQYDPYHHPSTGIPAAVPPPPPPLPMGVPPQLTPAPWTSGLCDCTDDCGNCCVTCWCPCVTFGQIAEIVDRGSSSCAMSGAFYFLINYLTGCGCLYSCFYRAKLRSQYALHESPCADCLVHCFCEQCALCQEYRELKNRGFDMSLGWQGNLEKQAQLASTTAPSAVGSMMR